MSPNDIPKDKPDVVVSSLADAKARKRDEDLGKVAGVEGLARWMFERDSAANMAVQMILSARDDDPEGSSQNMAVARPFHEALMSTDYRVEDAKLKQNAIPVTSEQLKMFYVRDSVGNGLKIQSHKYRAYLKTPEGNLLPLYFSQNQEGEVTDYYCYDPTKQQ